MYELDKNRKFNLLPGLIEFQYSMGKWLLMNPEIFGYFRYTLDFNINVHVHVGIAHLITCAYMYNLNT